MAKKFTGKFLLMSALLASVSLVSCDKSNSSKEVEYIPVQTTEDGAWIFIDSNGERVGEQEWEFQPSMTIGGIFSARDEDGLITVYRWKGKEAQPVDSLRNLVSVGVLSEGMMPVTPQMERIRIVDRDGDVKFVLDPIDEKEITSCAAQFSEGLLIVTNSDGKTGVINSKGDVIVAPEYNDITNYSDGFALAAKYDYDNFEAGPKYYVLDKEGNATKVKGEFGFEESECGIMLQPFCNGYTYVDAKPVEESDGYTYSQYRVSTDGTATKLSSSNWVTPLRNGGVITYAYKNDQSVYTWTDKEDAEVMKKKGSDVFMGAYGNYVGVKSNDKYTIYDLDGQEAFKLKGENSPYWSEGKFGLITVDYDESPAVYQLLDKEGNAIKGAKFYGVGTNEVVNLSDEDMVYDCGNTTVTSAYVDITAAASKLATMLTEGVKGKSYYYLGESAADILSGDNANYYSGQTTSFSLPTDSTYYLASGAGFWINGSGLTNTRIVEPTYQQYFQVDHYDWWGRPWGYNRTKQVGVHFNKSAKVIAFDLKLHTNHPSGQALREALARRLKKASYTLTKEENNYEEYTNGNRNILVYGNQETNGIGAIVYDNNSGFSKTSAEKAALASQL